MRPVNAVAAAAISALAIAARDATENVLINHYFFSIYGIKNIHYYCSNVNAISSNNNYDYFTSIALLHYLGDSQFEKLVNNPEEESKKLMKFCELPWDKKCLALYKRKDLISKTASNIQIRKAIYKHSLDKYLPYKKFLDKYGKKYSWFN